MRAPLYELFYPRPAALALTVASLAGCADPGGGAGRPAAEPPEPGVAVATREGPAGAPPGTCWGKTVTPAVIETVTSQVQVEPAKMGKDGTITALPVYRTESNQQIVRPRQENWFETPCPDTLDPEFYASLQRALQARGFYSGAITGIFDGPTRTALRRYQRQDGPDSEVLALTTARNLGLVIVPLSAL